MAVLAITPPLSRPVSKPVCKLSRQCSGRDWTPQVDAGCQSWTLAAPAFCTRRTRCSFFFIAYFDFRNACVPLRRQQTMLQTVRKHRNYVMRMSNERASPKHKDRISVYSAHCIYKSNKKNLYALDRRHCVIPVL